METNKSNKKSIKLVEFSKKEIFTVPDDYFDKLPTIIQTKAVESTKMRRVFSTEGVLKLAIPSILLLLMAGYFGYKYQNQPARLDSKIELMLAEVSTEEMVSFLDDSGLSSDELLELVSFEGERIDDFSDELENISDEELELLINDFEFEAIENI